jgi:MoaA/NifB/PqqE/SkfB family radical SAM enzyme
MRAITVGLACNNACVFCAQGERRLPVFDVEQALGAVEPGETVAFQGGEPTLRDELPAWIRAAEARGAAVVLVQTNGRRLAYRGYARALREASGRLALDVSLHGSTAPMHEYHTGVPGSFAQTVQGIRNARAEGIPVGITAVVTRSSFRHLAELVRVAHAAGASAVHFAPAEPFGRAARDRARVIAAPDMVVPHLTRAVAEAQRLGMGVQVADRTPAKPAAPRFAGIGQVERFEPLDAAPPPKKKVSLAVVGAAGELSGPEQGEEHA